MKPQAEQLKVGLVSPYAWTSRWGVNRHVGGLAKTLSALGHDVSVIVPAEERSGARSARKRAKAAKRTDRGRRKVMGTSSAASPATSRQAQARDVEPYRLIKVSGTFRVPYSESLANLALPLDITEHLNQLLAEESFDILHVHEPYPPSLSFTALRMTHCPVVATFHTAGERFLSYQLMRPVIERFFSRLDGRICTSQSTRRIVASYFPGSYSVITGGVDTASFSPASEAPAGAPLIIYAAWGEPRKSLALLLRTIRLLPDDMPSFELAIAGGEELAWRANLVVPRRLRGQISFSGLIGDDDLPSEYARADALCAPYATSGLSTAIMEAMAGATAVVVPGQGGLKELVGEGEQGLLLDHPYSYNLAASLVDLLHTPRLRQSLKTAAARKAARYSWDKTAAQTVKVYHRAHGRRSRQGLTHGAIESVQKSDTILADLHMHTSYSSDCATTPEEFLAACEESGLKAVAVTDHNTIQGALEVSRLAPRGLHVIVGEEIKTREGEIIGLYLREEIPRGLSARTTIKRIKEQGGLVYVPHPFDPLHTTPSYELLASCAAEIDILEVYNPRITFTSFNEKARQLARKYDIPGGAGSDCHVVQGIGTAMLSLRKFKNSQELLASLREADIIRSSKSPLYLHSLKLLSSRRAGVNEPAQPDML